MRKHVKRKHWNVAPGFSAVAHAIAGAAITPAEDLNKLRMVELAALDSYKAGSPTVADWRTLADMVNVCETFARDGIGPEALEAVERAEAALLAGYQRSNAHGRIGRGAGEYEALLDVFEYHDLQRQSVARSAYERVIQKTMDRIRSGHPDNKVLT